MVMVRDWLGMRRLASRFLKESTGEDLETWNRRVELEGPSDEKILRIWLAQRGVTGFTQSYLVVERFGYPDELAVTADELVDGLFADRPALRLVYEAIVDAMKGHGDVLILPMKSRVSFLSPLRLFARVDSPSPDRLDLHLRLEGIPVGGRLEKSEAYENLPIRIGLGSPADFDDEVRGWLHQAYAENS